MPAQQTHVLGNIPAGYECRRSALLADGAILTTHWLAPGGTEVYSHVAVAYLGEEKEEQFWERVIEYVSLYVRMRAHNMVSFEAGAATFKKASVSDKPPTMEIDYDPVQPASPDKFLTGVRTADGSFNLVRNGDGDGGGPADGTGQRPAV